MMIGSYRTSFRCAAGLLLVVCAGCSGTTPPSSTPASPPSSGPAPLIELTVDEEPHSVVSAECSRAEEKLDVIYTKADSDKRYFRRVGLSKVALDRMEAAGKIRVRGEKSGEGIEAPCKFVDQFPHELLLIHWSDLSAFQEITFAGVARKEGVLLIGGVDNKIKRLRWESHVSPEKVGRIEACGKLLIVYDDAKDNKTSGQVKGEYRCTVEPDYEVLKLLYMEK